MSITLFFEIFLNIRVHFFHKRLSTKNSKNNIIWVTIITFLEIWILSYNTS